MEGLIERLPQKKIYLCLLTFAGITHFNRYRFLGGNTRRPKNAASKVPPYIEPGDVLQTWNAHRFSMTVGANLLADLSVNLCSPASSGKKLQKIAKTKLFESAALSLNL